MHESNAIDQPDGSRRKRENESRKREEHFSALRAFYQKRVPEQFLYKDKDVPVPDRLLSMIDDGRRTLLSHQYHFVKKMGQELNVLWRSAKESKCRPFEPFQVSRHGGDYRAYVDPDKCLAFTIVQEISSSNLVGSVALPFHVPPEAAAVKPPMGEDEYDGESRLCGKVCLQLKRAADEFVFFRGASGADKATVSSKAGIDFEQSIYHFRIIEKSDCKVGQRSSVVVVQCLCFQPSSHYFSVSNDGLVEVKICDEYDSNHFPEPTNFHFSMDGIGYHMFKSLLIDQYLGFSNSCGEKAVLIKAEDLEHQLSNASFFIRPLL